MGSGSLVGGGRGPVCVCVCVCMCVYLCVPYLLFEPAEVCTSCRKTSEVQVITSDSDREKRREEGDDKDGGCGLMTLKGYWVSFDH